MPFLGTDKQQQYKKQWGIENKVRLRPSKKEWARKDRIKNKEKRRLREKEYRLRPGVKEHLNANNRKHRATWRRVWQNYKAEKGCKLCLEHDPACLDFHHRDPKTKDFNFGSSYKRYSPTWFLKEIEKCDVLCANCHRKFHHYNREV